MQVKYKPIVKKKNDLDYPEEEIESVTDEIQPPIDAGLLREYIIYAKHNYSPTLTEETRERIKDFYIDLRMNGDDEDSAVPITEQKLDALVRLSEASARLRLSDRVIEEDAQRAIDVVQSSLRDIGKNPETGEFDADIIEEEMSKSQRDRVKKVKDKIEEIEKRHEKGAPEQKVINQAEELEMDESKVAHEIDKLKQMGELYEPMQGYLRST